MFKSCLRLMGASFLSLLLTTAYAFTAQAQELNPRIQFLLSTKITHHGPNCWNSALFASGVLAHFRFTSAKEFKHLIDSPLCLKVPAGQQQPGDIQVYRRTMPDISDEDREVHANVWLNDQLTFNKKTDFSTAAYEVTTHAIVNESYGQTADILRFDSVEKSVAVQCQGDTCRNSIEYRRCGNLENMKRQDPHYSAQVEYLVSSMELAIQQQVRSPAKASPAWNAYADKVLTSLNTSIQQACGHERSFYCEHSRNVLESLTWQVHRPQPNWLK
ncbi:hypothetical protein AZI86_18870 [Bdellovibrio bacteriovorus]|uniref:Secreted protein n=2 Tax=Bdellovibrio bacteriovorus TaxID=959 RepID=A0A150WDI2_BDEBC|nr:hypothetical protein AZI86_18870 [Bdellovibrio bacteriovorus]